MILPPIGQTIGQTGPAESENQPNISVGGGAYFLNRKAFRLIQPQNQTEDFATQTVGDPFEYDTSGLGSFGTASLEHPIGSNLAIGASFFGASLENEQFRPVPGGGGRGNGGGVENGSVIPQIAELHQIEQHGSVVNVGADPNNKNAQADTRFKYDTQQYDVAVDLIGKGIVSCKDWEVDGLVGFAYTRINQDSDLDTLGLNPSVGSETRTSTHEILRDNLFGGRVGLKARRIIASHLSWYGNVTGSFFQDNINYHGSQEFSSAVYVLGNRRHNFTVEHILTENRFVPRLEVQTGLSYQILPGFSLVVAYSYDSFWEVSNVDHPTARFDGIDRDVVDHPVRIGSENLTQHSIQLKLTYKF